MDTIRGPPASPSFTGWGIPGNKKGVLPRIHPNAMPKKIGITDEKLYDNFSLQKAGRAFYGKLRVCFGN